MWMRLLICMKDKIYAQRLTAFWEREYGDKMEISVFSEPQYLQESEKSRTADIVLFGDEYVEEAVSISKNTPWTWAVLTQQIYEGEQDSVVRLAKYQRADILYKEVLDLYSENGRVRQTHALAKSGGDCQVYVFLAASGGVGTTTVARAYAAKCAQYERVVYLDLRMFEAGWQSNEEDHGMEEVILALKSRRDILSIKLMSAVSDTSEKVKTYAPGRDPLNLLEITGEDVKRLVEMLRGLGEYQKIVFDAGNNLTAREIALFECADSLICVAQDDENNRIKYEKLYKILGTLELKDHVKLYRKMMIFRNKAVRKERIAWGGAGVRECGWAPKVEEAAYQAVIARIKQSDAFDEMEGNNVE